MAGGFNFTTPGGAAVPTVAAQSLVGTVGNVFKPFNAANDIVTLQKNIITKGLWTNDAGDLTTFFTSSNQTSTNIAESTTTSDGNAKKIFKTA